MNTDASRSVKATSSSNSTTSSASRVSGLGILSPPSPEFPNIPTQQPQFVSAIGRVTDLSPSPPDYYASAPSFAALTQPASSSATGPLPAPIFATQRHHAPVVPFIPPTPASASCASFQPPAGQYPTSSAQIGYSLPTFSESPSVNLAQRVFYVPSQYANAGLIRQAVSQLSLGRANTHPDERETYASDLVEQMIEALFRLWPDHRETNEPSSPVMAQAMISQNLPSGNLDPRLRNVQQQATPESSPDLVMDKNRKRKRVGIMEEPSRLHKRRSVDAPGSSLGAAPRSSLQVSLPPVNPTNTMPMPHQATSSISLRVFCWELLRRSKTTIPSLEVALCYLDVVGDKVRELRECYLNGGAGFDCGPEMLQSRRRVFDEALRDRGRIVSRKEHLAQEKQKKSHLENLQRQSSWRPLSPPDLDAMSTDSESRAGSCSFSQSSTMTDSGDEIEETPEILQLKREILSSHPLLDPRRTLLAALVLATKFLQDRAYSNRAWAKLSGLPGHEVGRCERALGGALGWRLWVGKNSHSGSSGGSPSHDAGPSFVQDTSDPEDPEADDGSNDPTFLRLLDIAKKATSSSSGSQQNRSNSLAMESAHSVPQSRSMTWPSLPSAFSVSAPPPHAAASLGDYSSILSSAQSFDSSSATATPLPIPPPPNATVMDPSGAWYSSYVHPQFLVDHKTATSIEDAKRILGEDGVDQYGQMAGLASSSPMQHPVFASKSVATSGKLGGADCASPSTPPYVQAWNNSLASTQRSDSSDMDQLKAFSDYWINGDGLIPATYVPNSPLTPTSGETFTQRDARQDTLVASTPGSTIFGFGCPSRTSTLVADPNDQIMSDAAFQANLKGKTDDMMAVLTNDLVSTTISSKAAGLWFVPPTEQPQFASMI